MEVADEKIARISSLTRLYLAISGCDDRGVRAKLQRLEHRHGRAHAEGARHVAGRDDDAASARMTDDQRLAGELRPVALLDGGIEGIAIDVGDAEALDLRMRQKPRAAASAARFGASRRRFHSNPGTAHASWLAIDPHRFFQRSMQHRRTQPAPGQPFPATRGTRQHARSIYALRRNAWLLCEAEPHLHHTFHALCVRIATPLRRGRRILCESCASCGAMPCTPNGAGAKSSRDGHQTRLRHSLSPPRRLVARSDEDRTHQQEVGMETALHE